MAELNPILRVLLQGVYDENSNLSKLRGMPHLVETIWNFFTDYWKSCIKAHHAPIDYFTESQVIIEETTAVTVANPYVTFPEPAGRYYNMMPFILAENFDECKLPEDCRQYWNNIICSISAERDMEKVCYLTIHESDLEPGEFQRRPGVHTDRPGVIYSCDGRVENSSEDFGKGGFTIFERHYFHWGQGIFNCKYLNGGIYFASNVENSTRVWNCEINQDAEGRELIGVLGDVEHLRKFFPVESCTLDADVLYWMTDRTPHESLPMPTQCSRQFIRIVMSPVSVWYADHSTPNPYGVVPDPSVTKIVEGSKFEKNSMRFATC